MSAHVAGIIAQYSDRNDLGSGARHILRRAKEYAGVTPEQQAELDRILRDDRAAKKANEKPEAQSKRDVHAEKMQELADREAAIEGREKVADLNVVLTAEGATGQDLADATALLERALNGSREAVEISSAVDALKVRRPQLFGEVPAAPRIRPKPVAGLPVGGPPRKAAGGRQPGASGRAYAERRGFTQVTTNERGAS